MTVTEAQESKLPAQTSSISCFTSVNIQLAKTCHIVEARIKEVKAVLWAGSGGRHQQTNQLLQEGSENYKTKGIDSGRTEELGPIR